MFERPAPLTSRRAVVAGGLLLPLAPRLAFAAGPVPRNLTFAVFRNDSHIGEHHISFTGDGAAFTATTDAVMNVKIGPVPFFRYHHHAVETRKDGAFASLETSTTTNGKAEHVVAEREGGAVRIDCPSGKTTLSADTNPLTHWNEQIFAGPLFNPQTGKLLKVRVAKVAPNRWAIHGEVDMEDTYDDTGAWLAAKARADDGSTVEYRRI